MEKFIGKYRLKQIKKAEDNAYNCLFLPGGPGIGADYLESFVTKLPLKNNLFIADFPGDGSNRNCQEVNFDLWRNGLIELIQELQPCILVTHSFSGMFALSIPELEKLLKGLVIISSAPDSSWIAESINTIKKYNLPDISKAIKKMNDEPTDDNLKLLFYECIPYLFEPNEIAAGRVILEQNQYNIMTRLWGHNIFHPQFKYQWIPDKLPTLIIGSSSDKTLPMLLFTRAKEFQKSNIKMVDLKDVGHYPWLAKFTEVSNLMLEFSQLT